MTAGRQLPFHGAVSLSRRIGVGAVPTPFVFAFLGRDKKTAAIDLLKLREGDGAKGLPVTPKIGRLRFEEAAQDVINDYRVNGKRSLDEVERKIRETPGALLWRPAHGGDHDRGRADLHRRATGGDPHDLEGLRTEISGWPHHQHPGTRTRHHGASNGEINRELAILKRIFNLAVQAGKLLHKPYIPLLREDNTRTGFFDADQFRSVLRHLPTPLQPVIEFAYITGWRIMSEVLPLQWHQIDFDGDEVRLEAGTTKNGEGRVFPLTDDLRALLETQFEEHQRLKAKGEIMPVGVLSDGRESAWRPQAPETHRRVQQGVG